VDLIKQPSSISALKSNLPLRRIDRQRLIAIERYEPDGHNIARRLDLWHPTPKAMEPTEAPRGVSKNELMRTASSTKLFSWACWS
jgi:hypothetical protein